MHLLKSEEFEDEPIVSVTAIALRNLAIDQKNKVLIGKYAMKDLVYKLPDPNRPMPIRLSVLNEDTITAALACINECIKSSDEFVKSCYNEGGVKRMVFITRNGQHFPIKIVKYAAHVSALFWFVLLWRNAFFCGSLFFFGSYIFFWLEYFFFGSNIFFSTHIF